MMPPPETTIEAGGAGSERASSLVMTPSRSYPGTSGTSGTDPVAMTMASAWMALPFTSTVWGSLMAATPSMYSMPLPCTRLNVPFTRRETVSVFRFISASQSSRVPSTSTPMRFASDFNSVRSSAVCSSTLVGIQPTLRQVPPMVFFSIRVTEAPRCAA